MPPFGTYFSAQTRKQNNVFGLRQRVRIAYEAVHWSAQGVPKKEPKKSHICELTIGTNISITQNSRDVCATRPRCTLQTMEKEPWWLDRYQNEVAQGTCLREYAIHDDNRTLPIHPSISFEVDIWT